MRDLFKNVMTGSMVAGAALLVAACGGGEVAENTATTELETVDPMMEGTTNDVTAIDGANGADANLGMDANMTMDANMAGNTADMNMTGNTTDMNMTGNATNGM